MYTATPSISRSPSGVAPSRTSAVAWKPRQASQRLATPMAMAISSLVFSSSAPGAIAALLSAPKPFITSALWLRNGVRLRETARVRSV